MECGLRGRTSARDLCFTLAPLRVQARHGLLQRKEWFLGLVHEAGCCERAARLTYDKPGRQVATPSPQPTGTPSLVLAV